MSDKLTLGSCKYCGQAAEYSVYDPSDDFSRTTYHIIRCTFCPEVRQFALTKEAVYFLWNGGLIKHPEIIVNGEGRYGFEYRGGSTEMNNAEDKVLLSEYTIKSYMQGDIMTTEINGPFSDDPMMADIFSKALKFVTRESKKFKGDTLNFVTIPKQKEPKCQEADGEQATK